MHLSPNVHAMRSHESSPRRPLRLVGRDEHVVHLVQTASPPAIRVAIAFAPPLLRAGLRALLEAEADVTVAGEAATGEQAVELAGRSHIDVMLVDLELPGIGALEAIRRITAEPRLPGTRVMAVTASPYAGAAVPAIVAGASGVLVHDTEPAALRRAVRALAGGEAVVTAGVIRKLIAELTAGAQA